MPGVPAPPTILSFEEARRVVESHAATIRPVATESIALLAAAGRVLAKPILADRDFPPFPRSTRDGYAVRSADLPATLDVIAEIKAGERIENIPTEIRQGQSASIMTGAPVPSGADAVVMIEHTTRDANRVTIGNHISAGENIVPRGAEAQQGSVLLDRGLRLTEAAIALAASVGKSPLEVFPRPRVAILTTGDEIVDIDSTPGPTQIRNSNSYSLAAQIIQAGGQPILLPIAPDEPRMLRRLIERGLQSDLLLLTGGVSMGRYDLVEQVLSEMHAEFFFTGAKIQPGKPIVFGRCPSGAAACGAGAPAREKVQASTEAGGARYFFGLPGNPISTMVTFDLLAKPILASLAGMQPAKLLFLHARLKSDVRTKTGLTRFLPAILTGEFANAAVALIPWHGSGDLAAIARSNCYLVIPPDRELLPAGDWVTILPR